MGLVFVFKKFIKHLDGFFRYFKHGILLIGNFIFLTLGNQEVLTYTLKLFCQSYFSLP